MRPPTLQYLYLQKPLALLIIISVIGVGFGVGFGSFSSFSELNDISISFSVLKNGNFFAPHDSSGQISGKSPLLYWLIALFSLMNGSVTKATATLPSAISYLVLISVCFFYFGRRYKFHQAFLAALIILSCFQMHRSAVSIGSEMLFTSLSVSALILLYDWEEGKKLKGIPWMAALVISMAVLTKGLIGLVIPVLVFSVYIFILGYRPVKAVKSIAGVTLLSLVLPALWYVLSMKRGGSFFVAAYWKENLSLLPFGTSDSPVPVWKNFFYLLFGFMPYTFIVFFSVFGIKEHLRRKLDKLKASLKNMPREKIFSILSVMLILLIFCLSPDKKSSYLMPAYPFIAIYISDYILYIVDNRSVVYRIFGLTLALVGMAVTVFSFLTAILHVIDPARLASRYFQHPILLSFVSQTASCLQTKPGILYFLSVALLVFFIVVLFNQVKKGKSIKLLYASIAVYLSVILLADIIFVPAYQNSVTVEQQGAVAGGK